MTGIGSFAAKEAAAATGPEASPLPSLAPGDGGGRARRALHSTVVNVLTAAPRRLWQAEPSAREGVWVNAAQPPDDPETSWPSTVFNPLAREPEEMVVPTGPPTEDLVALPEADSGYGNRRLMARRRPGRHAAPPADIVSRLARKLAANR